MTFNVGAAEQHRATLALGSDFGEQELRTAYRSLIRRWHPDFFIAESQAQRDATEKAKTINVAYEFLSEVLEEHGGRYAIPGRERGSDRGRAASWEMFILSVLMRGNRTAPAFRIRPLWKYF